MEGGRCACPRAHGAAAVRRLTYLLLAKPRFTSHAELEVCKSSILGIHEESGALLTIQSSSLSLILFTFKTGNVYLTPDPLHQPTANHAHSRSIQSRIPARRRRPTERASDLPAKWKCQSAPPRPPPSSAPSNRPPSVCLPVTRGGTHARPEAMGPARTSVRHTLTRPENDRT